MNNQPQGEQGSTLVEFALSFVFILVLSGGIIDLGLYYFSQHIAQELARDAARTAAVIPGFSPTGSQAFMEAYIESAIPDGLSLLEDYDVNLALNSVVGVEGRMVEVEIIGPYKNFFLQLVGIQSMIVSAKSTMRYEA